MKKIVSLILVLLACVALVLISACDENEDVPDNIDATGDIFDENEYGEFTLNYTVYFKNEQNKTMSKLTQSKEEFDEYAQGEDERNSIAMIVSLNLAESNNYSEKLTKFAELYGIELNSEIYDASMSIRLPNITIIFEDYECYREYGDPIIGRLEPCDIAGCLTVKSLGWDEPDVA